MSSKKFTNNPKVEFQYISPDNLDFDPNNPRFSEDFSHLSQVEIQERIYGDPYYGSELVDSLLENGFIDFEPLVVKHATIEGRYIVIEGNRRLSAIKQIRGNLKKYEAESDKIGDLERIPVLVFPKGANDDQENEMRVYLGVRHLLGFREWPPLSKAQFLERESKRDGGLDKVLKETRLSRGSAKRFLIPLRILRMSGEKIPDGEDFSNLSEALGRSGPPQFIELETDSKTLEIKSYNKKKLQQLLDDLYGKKQKGLRDANSKVVTDTREISTYSRVLSSKPAAEVLHSGKTLAEAEIYVDTREESLKRLEKINKQMGALLKKITTGERRPENAKVNAAYKEFDQEIKKFILSKK